MMTPDEYLFNADLKALDYSVKVFTKAELIEQFKQATLREINDFVAQIDKECSALIKNGRELQSTKTLIYGSFMPLRKIAEKYARIKMRGLF